MKPPNKRLARGINFIGMILTAHAESIGRGERAERRRINEALDAFQWLKLTANEPR